MLLNCDFLNILMWFGKIHDYMMILFNVLILFILFLFTPQPHHPVYSSFASSSSFIIFGYTLLVSGHCSIVVFQQQRQHHHHKLIPQQTRFYFKIETSLLDDDTETVCLVSCGTPQCYLRISRTFD